MFGSTIAELQTRMSLAEFRLVWVPYLQIEPVGEERLDHAAAEIVHAIQVYIWARGGGKGAPPVTRVTDWWAERDPPVTEAVQGPREKRLNLLAGLGVLNRLIKRKPS